VLTESINSHVQPENITMIMSTSCLRSYPVRQLLFYEPAY